ncbi:MAG: choice-of-anchor D domain-containing protein [Ignavibacteriales bacterium]|nr:choice-of-anchor D domain-containing protein [Ignavibacteriales bacterium]
MRKIDTVLKIAILSLLLASIAFGQTMINVWNPTTSNTNMYGKSNAANWRGIAVDKRTTGAGAGRVYISNSLTGAQKISYWEKAQWDSALTPSPWPAGSFGTTQQIAWGTAPYGICVDDDGNVLVSDYSNKKIYRFNPAAGYAVDSLKILFGTTTFVADTSFRYLHCTGSYAAGTLKLYYVHDGSGNKNVMSLVQTGANKNDFSKNILFSESNDGTFNYAALASADGNTVYVSSNASTAQNGLVKYVYSSGAWSIAPGWPVIALTVQDINFHGTESALVISVPGSRVFNKVSTADGSRYYGVNYGRGGITPAYGGAAAYDTTTCFALSSTGSLSSFDKISYFTPTPLSGDYYIPQGSNPKGFSSLERAFWAVNENGVSGTVRLLIDGDLTESADILALVRTDLSATNNLVIKPNVGKTPTITISDFSTSSATITNNRYTGIQIENSSYVTIDGSNTVDGTTKDLSIKINYATYGLIGIQLFGNVDFVKIKNLNLTFLTNVTTNVNSRGINGIGQSSGVLDNLLIENCSIGDATYPPSYGISIVGYSTAPIVYTTNVTIRKSILKGSMRGMNLNLAGSSGTTYEISNNILDCAPPTGYVVWGILLNSYGGIHNIFNNKITSLRCASTTTEGVYAFGTLSGQSGATLNIYNNMIGGDIQHTGTGTPAAIDLISLQDDSPQANIYYNTFYLNNFAKTALRMSGIRYAGGANVNSRNNIIVVDKDNALAFGIYDGGTTGTVVSDNNIVYVSGTLSNFGYKSSARKTLYDWTLATGRDINSAAENPVLISSSDFHINTSGTEYQPLPSATGRATPIAGITTDYDGDVRDVNKPDIGADEFGAVNRVITTTGTINGGATDNLTINGAGITATLNGSLAVNGTLTLTSGTLDISSGTLAISNPIAGTLTNMTAGANTNLTMGGTASGFSIPSTITTLKTLTINNINGAALSSPLAIDSLALLTGNLNNGTNLVTITGTTPTKVNQIAGYVKGPLARTLPASLLTGTEYNFPIGKSAGHLFELVNPITTSAGTVVVQAEEVEGSSGGTGGTGIGSLMTNRYWKTSLPSGSSNFTGAAVRVTDVFDGNSIFGMSSTQTGAYNSIGGFFDGSRLQSGPITSLAYIAVGARGSHLAGGTYTVGTGGTYANLTAAAADLNSKILDASVIFELLPAYSSAGETFPLTFYKYPFGVTIRPQSGASGLSINGTDTSGTIILSGATGLTIDGRSGGVGTSRNLTINNTVFGTYTTAPAMQFTNDASNNVLKYCILKAKDTTSSGSVVKFGSTIGTTGNDNNLVDNCEVDGQGTARSGIYSSGTSLKENSGNTISNCDIHDVYISVASKADIYGIYLTSNNTNWTITGNNIYQTTPRAYYDGTDGGAFSAIRINNTSGNGFVISNNVIGGSAPNAGGAPWTVTAGQHKFNGIYLAAGTATPTSVQGNIIKNLDLSTTFITSGSLCTAFINLGDGSFNVGTTTGNTIGSPTDTSSIRIRVAAATTTEGGRMVGIYFSGATGVVNVENNTVGGITIDCGGLATAVSLSGTLSSSSVGATYSLKNNLIGSLTTPKSIKIFNSTSTSATQTRMAGIRFQTGTTNIQNNTIANLAMEPAFGYGQLYGIYSSGGTTTISGNTIRSLKTNSTNVNTNSTTGSLHGILLDPGNDNYQVISGNTISDLMNTAPGNLAVWVYGIYPVTTTTATRMLIENNIISAINVASNNNAATICGLYGSTGGAVIRNNMVTLGKDASGADITNPITIVGLRKATSSSSLVANNTVVITGSGVADVGTGTVGTRAFERNTVGVDTVMNNIFINNRSNTNASQQKHYAVRLNLTTTLASNFNILNAAGTGGNIGSTDNGTTPIVTFSDWKTGTSLDMNSLNGDPSFLPNSLYINPDASPVSIASNAGVPLALVTTDISGDLRSLTNPDIGADEFAANMTTAGGSINGGSYGTLTITSAATLVGSIEVTGILTLNASLTVGANTLALQRPIAGTLTNLITNNTSSMTIGGTVAGINVPSHITQLNNLSVNNANGTTLQNNLVVNGVLNLVNGKVITGNKVLTVVNPITGAGSLDFVEGNLAVPVASSGSKILEVGIGSTYLPATAVVTGSGDTLKAIVADKTAKPLPAGANTNSVLKYYYTITAGSSVTFTSLTLAYDQTGLDAAKENALRVFLNNGTTWSELTVSSRDAVANSVTVSSVPVGGGVIVISTGSIDPVFSTWWGKSIDFGFIDIKKMVVDTLYVKNENAQAMTISNVIVPDTNFRIQPSAAGPIVPGDSAKFVFTYDPAVPGQLTTYARFMMTGVSPYDSVRMTGKSEYPVLSVSVPLISFGDIPINVPRKDSVNVKNTATVAQLNISAITSTNPRYAPSPISAVLNPGDSAKIYVTFTPTSGATENGYIVFQHDALNMKDSMAVNGKGSLPGFNTSKRLVDFGTVGINTTKQDTVLVWNTSLSALVVDSVSIQSPYIKVLPASKSISSGDTARFQFSFTPVIGGDFNEKVVFYHNATTLRDTVIVKGFALLPILTISKSGTVNMGNVRVGRTAVDSIVLSNLTIASLHVDSVGLNNKAEYSMLPLLTTIPPQGSVTVKVSFKPTGLGNRPGTFILYHDGVSKKDSINYLGVGVLPNFAASTTNKQFGSVVVAVTKADTMYVKNTGTDSLTITAVTSNSPEFSVVTPSANMVIASVLPEAQQAIEPVKKPKAVNHGGDAEVGSSQETSGLEIQQSNASGIESIDAAALAAVPFKIKPADSARIIIRFTPASTGVKTAKLFFVHDAPKGADTVQLGGTGVQATFSITPKSLAFKTMMIGLNTKDSVAVTNVGTSALSISGITSANPEFSISPVTATIDTGKTQKFYVTFVPATVGARSAKFVFAHNGASKDTLSVSGNVLAVGTIRQARLAANASEVAFEGIATRVKGNYTYMQDTSAGMTMYIASGAWKDSVTSGGIKAGDKIRVLGKTSEYNALKEVVAADLYGFTIVSRTNALPAAKLVTLAKMVSNGEDYEAQLVKVITMKIVAGTDTAYVSARSYNITDPTDTSKTVVLRIPNATDNSIAGTKILTKAVTFTGVVGQFSSASPTAGYQLMAINADDITDNVLGVKDPLAEIPQEYDLSNNYPNPFNPTTTIRYALPVSSHVTLKIYNVIGEEITTLVSGMQDASFYTIEWNGRSSDGVSVASGVYFYRIVVESADPNVKPFVRVKKMVMLK